MNDYIKWWKDKIDQWLINTEEYERPSDCNCFDCNVMQTRLQEARDIISRLFEEKEIEMNAMIGMARDLFYLNKENYSGVKDPIKMIVENYIQNNIPKS